MRRKVTKQMLAAGLTVIMLFSALFPVNAFALGGQGNMAGIEGTVPAQAAQDAPEYYAFLRNLKVLEGYAQTYAREHTGEDAVGWSSTMSVAAWKNIPAVAGPCWRARRRPTLPST